MGFGQFLKAIDTVDRRGRVEDYAVPHEYRRVYRTTFSCLRGSSVGAPVALSDIAVAPLSLP